MGTVYLYTTPGCGACAIARALASARWGDRVREVEVDSPFVEVGIQVFFGGLVVTPVVVVPDEAVYKLDGEGSAFIEHASLLQPVGAG